MKKCKRRDKECEAMFYDGTNGVDIIKWLRDSGIMASEYQNTHPHLQDKEHRFIRVSNPPRLGYIVGLAYESHTDEVWKGRWIIKEFQRMTSEHDQRNPIILRCCQNDIFESDFVEVPDGEQ